jgi:hypothetical protein
LFLSCVLVCSSCVPLLILGIKNQTDKLGEEKAQITRWIQDKDYVKLDTFIAEKAESEREKYYRMAAEAALDFDQFDKVLVYAEKTTKKKDYLREAAKNAMYRQKYNIAFDFYGLLGDKSSQRKAADAAEENEMYSEAAYCYAALGESKKAEEARVKDEIRTKAKELFNYYEIFIDKYIREHHGTWGLAVLKGRVVVKPEELLISEDYVEISKILKQYMQENEVTIEHIIDLGTIYSKMIKSYTDYSQEAVRWGRQGLANRYNILANVVNQTISINVPICYIDIQ